MRVFMPAIQLLITALFASVAPLPAADSVEGWQPLFDGKSLEGWATTGKSEGWAVEAGAIVCQVQGGGYLYTKRQYEDFAISLEFKVSPPAPKVNPKTKKEEMHKCNSGVFVRWSDLKNPVHTGIEVQVFDSVGTAVPGKHDCGALYDMVAPSKNVEKPVGEWNRMVITCKGPIISVELNGEKICEMNEDQYDTAGQNPDGTKNKYKFPWKTMPRRGHIGFQDHGHRVWFKDVKIKAL
ncbi:MAG TPA: DUF1080 domain-containing protein [Verrucomicrobiae bacterium]|nr:DUF1080 domain-containing protein [Verrucomicrobiae bacterium]